MLSIDITDKQVKLVRGTLSGNKIRVLEVETRDLTVGCISNGYITDIPMIAGEITDIIATKNIKDKDAVVCINSGSILYKELSVPKPKKITNSAAIESMILTTMGITKEYNISYSIIGEENDENGQPQLKIIATACPQRMVDGYIRLFTQLGIKLQQINVSNNCITRLILNTPKLESSMPLMLVQCDSDFLNINLYEDGQVTMSRYIRIDPYDYGNDDDYMNQAVYDNLFRTIQFTSQRKGARPLKEIMFYGQVRDFISLSNAVSSFNVPAHILSMPNNIVTFCDFDFAEYANAIGAFFKVRKDYDHVNLLDSSAVKEKKSVSKFAIGLGLGALLAVGACAATTFIINGIVSTIEEQSKRIDTEIHSPEVAERREVLKKKISIYEDIELYRVSLDEADTIFKNQPKIVSEIRDKIAEVVDSFEDVYINGDIKVAGYGVDIEVVCKSQDVPTKFVRKLIEQDYFEAVGYVGFDGTVIEVEEEKDIFGMPVVTNKDEEPDVNYIFPLTMRLKGGNGCEIK